MELLKSNPIIDPRYKPSLDMPYMDYFTRAMAFAQTNYQDRLTKIANTHFRKLSPTSFLEEYAWCVMCTEDRYREASELFPALTNQLTGFYHSFWDLNNFPKEEDVKEKVMGVIHNEKKFKSIYNTAFIMNQGIKLFGWDRYKDNFLNSPDKLCVLPMIQMRGAQVLSRNVGISSDIISSARLHPTAVRLGFQDSRSLCLAIQKNVQMQLKVIEVILWYAVETFESNISEA
jgi:hypothetical protein